MKAPRYSLERILWAIALVAGGLALVVSYRFVQSTMLGLACWLGGGMIVGAGALLPLHKPGLGMMLGFAVQVAIAIVLLILHPLVIG